MGEKMSRKGYAGDGGRAATKGSHEADIYGLWEYLEEEHPRHREQEVQRP